jgi:hypothetical protein
VWLYIWTVTLAMSIGLSVLAMQLANDGITRGR